MSEEIAAIGLTMDTSGVDKGINSLDTLASKGTKVEKSMQGIEGAAAKTGKTLATLGQGAGKGLEEVGKDSVTAAAGIKKVGDESENASADLKKVETSGKAATATIDKMGVSAKQTAAALRGVPAQFTDIITSLQGGQNPLTVFLQQGGQLKDMFGGAGAAAKALGGYVVGLINPFTVAAAVAGSLALAYYQGSKEAEAYNKAIITTGNAAGVTAGQMQVMAQRISAIAGTQGDAANALATFVQAGAGGATQLEKFAGAAVRFQRTTGQAIDETAKQFAALGKSPVDAAVKLNESTNFLTASLYKQIKALEEQGKYTQAAALAQNAFADTLDSRSKEMERQLGTIERGWKNVKDAISGAWDAIKSVGRVPGLDQQIAQVQAQIEKIENRKGKVGLDANGKVINLEGGDVKALKEKLATLQESARIDARRVVNLAEQAELTKLMVAYDKDHEQSKTRKARMDEEILRTQTEGGRLVAAGLLTQKQLNEDIAAIREKYKETVSTEAAGILAQTKAQERYNALLKERGLGADKITEGEKQQLRLEEELKGKLDAKTRLAKEAALEAAKDLKIKQQEEQQIRRMLAAKAEYQRQELQWEEELVAAYVAESKAREQIRLQVDQYGKDVREQSDYAKLELQLAGQSIQVRERALAQYRIELELKKQIEAIDRSAGLDEAQREELRAQARVTATEAMATAEIKAQLTLWDSVDRAAHDTWVNVLNGGQDAFTKLRDTLKSGLYDLLYQMTVKKWVFDITAKITGSGSGGGVSNLLGEGGFGSSVTDGALSVGNLLLKSNNEYVKNIGSFLGQNSLEIGKYAEKAGAVLSYLEVASNFKDGSYGKSIGQGIGLALSGGNPIAGQIGKTIGNWVDGLFSKGEYVSSTGDSARYYNKDGSLKSNTASNGKDWWNNTEGANMFVDALQSKYLTSAKSLGIGTVGTQFSYGSNNSDGGKFSLGGGATGTGFGAYQGETKTTPEAVQLAASRAVFAALQGSDLPKYLQGIFDGIDANTATSEQIDNAIQTATAFKLLHDSLNGLPSVLGDIGDLSYTAMKDLVNLSGGLDKFGANLASAAKNYTTADQQKQATLTSIGTALSATGYTGPMPTDRVQYAALLKEAGSDASLATESGRKFYATLLDLNEAFASVTPTIDDMIKAVAGIHDSVQTSIFNMQYGMGTNQEKYNMLDVKGATLDEKMRSATGIVDIAKYAQDQIDLINQSWGLLDAQQQKDSYAQYEARLQAIDDYVTSKGADATSLQQAKDDKTATTIADKVGVAITDSMAEVVQALKESATAVTDAANKPAPVDVRVTVSKSAGSEVSVSY